MSDETKPLAPVTEQDKQTSANLTAQNQDTATKVRQVIIEPKHNDANKAHEVSLAEQQKLQKLRATPGAKPEVKPKV